MSNQIISWRIRPVFVSGTFRDMQAERDHLHEVIFPELERRLSERHFHLSAVDLRWGVETISIQAEKEKDLLVLKVCLDEIKRCRPFLIVLLGDRYGWTPPAERMFAAAQEQGYHADVSDKSITALEIEFGLFSDPNQQTGFFFYFRDIENDADMPPEQQAFYSDERSNDPEVKARYAKLLALKQMIETNPRFASRLRHYSLKWENNRLRGIEQWGQQVLDDLWKDLDAVTQAQIQAADPSWQGQERRTLEEFVELRSRIFVGREKILAELRDMAFSATGAETRGICLYGKPGSGKSAVFATLYRELHEKDCLVLAHAGGISLRAGSVDAMLRRWIQDLARHLGMEDKDPSEGLSGFDETKNLFAALLSQAAVKTRVICLVDALNQFERSVIARYLTWIPESLPPNVRLMTPAVEGDETAALSKRKDCRLMPLTDMDQSEAADMTHRICEQYHKKIHADIVAKLTGKILPDNSLAAGNPLWLKLAVEHLLLMDGDDFAEADRLEGRPEQKLHNFMLQMAESFPPEIEKLYDSLFRRASERFGKRQNIAWIPDMLDVIAASRQGLRDKDIKEVRGQGSEVRGSSSDLEPRTPNPVSFDLQFALTRRYLRAHLTQRSEQGLWDFTHAQARMSVLNSRLADRAYFKQCHCRMADYLESLPREDPLRITERMYHLIAADEKEKAAQLFGSWLSDSEEKACAKALCEKMLRQGEQGWAWVESLLDFARNSQDSMFSHLLCNRFNFDISDELEYQVTLSPRIRLLEANKTCLEALCAQFPDNADFARDLSVSYSKLGSLFLEKGEQARAFQYYEKLI